MCYIKYFMIIYSRKTRHCWNNNNKKDIIVKRVINNKMTKTFCARTHKMRKENLNHIENV